ncbi:chlorophyllase [Mycobacterium sp. E342]|uniref:alpha/beta hydrolase family protein n=1 Tax=Mycobacterium sp. E342 TaxID=1834147 RepID=UPI000800E522|nr:alpha/beta fold hydrolase [Mycobacterium sp. E342]OBH29008.1 chlorophyllase [Mycobacterium sp. E342]
MSVTLATADNDIDRTTPVISVRPVTLAAPDRGHDLQVRVSAPASGRGLPVIVFSHGMTLTMDDYVPLSEFWASRGFIVIQPTHLDSLGLAPDDPRTPDIWRIRVQDLTHIFDQLDRVEAAVPGLTGRIDRGLVVAAGHSWGAQTASMLAGAGVVEGGRAPGQSMADPRVKAALLLCLPGTGGTDLTPLATEYFPFMNPDFTDLTTPSLMVSGDHDQSPLSTRGPDWFTDGYRLSPGARDLLVLAGGEHGLGGIQGYNDTRTTDESPMRVAIVQHATVAWLRTALGIDDSAWPSQRQRLAANPEQLARVDSK